MKITKRQLRRIIREAFNIPDDVMDIYTDYVKAVQSGDKAEEKRTADHFKGVVAVLDQFDNVDGNREEEGSDEFSVQAFRNEIEEESAEEVQEMTRRKLRKVIREALMTESASEQALALLKSEYTVSSEKNVPGIRRDVNRETIYVRNDGQPVPPEDLKLLQDRDTEIRKKGGGMARLMGVYTSSMSPDGNSLIVKYHRTTAG